MGGVITEADGEHCTIRLRMPAGATTADQMIAAAQLAKKYGTNELHLTTRQTLEIPHISAAQIPAFYEDLLTGGNSIGAERNEVVNITACPGTERCKFANIDATGMAKKIDAKYFGKNMPGKIRIAISACPNACTSETLNEIGITGICTPIRQPGYCTGCGTCVQYCQEEALRVREGRVVMDSDACVDCGTCVRSCVYDILESKPASYRITLGGRRGRHPKAGMQLITVNSEETALKVIDLIIDWIYRYASFDTPIARQLGKDLNIDEFKASLPKKLPEGSTNT
ncbi:MAG: 4Fe-4S binding protein [Methanocalculaceae archaeon]|jgi:dissimilatory sulfite reductase (desulfoviridin) alpha/beta subunit|nr:4Fe-4S binding protein [Methanocalculaceae archaeon]